MATTIRGSRRLLTAVLLAVFLLSPAAGPASAEPQRGTPRRGLEILDAVIRYIKADYVNEPDPKTTMEGAFEGLVNSLDVLSGYLDKAAAAKYAAGQKRGLKATGVILFKRPGAFPLVTGVVAGSPAEKAGLRIGDLLSAVDDRSVLVWSLSEIILALKDEEPRPVKLRVIRENTTKEVAVERGDVYARPLTWTSQEGTAGIVRIHQLGAPLVAEFKATAVPKLRGRKSPLILDLRDCHEGSVEEARAFLNLFLKSDKAGTFEKKIGERSVLACPDAAPLDSLPLVLWVNPATMGPAELVAAVLKDVKKAKVVGLPTPGLVSGQEFFPLSDGDALLLTTSVFVTASGDKLWGKGLEPDARVDLDKADTKGYLGKTLGLIARR